MRPEASNPHAPPSGGSLPPQGANSPANPPAPVKSDWSTLARLFPYLWTYKWRVIAALVFMVGAKLANVGVPLLLKNLVDSMAFKPGDVQVILVVPVALLLGYGALRLSTSLFAELRELVFAKATEGASRSISLEVFRHLHAMSLRFHLERQTGGMTRDIERGTRGVHSLFSSESIARLWAVLSISFIFLRNWVRHSVTVMVKLM